FLVEFVFFGDLVNDVDATSETLDTGGGNPYHFYPAFGRLLGGVGFTDIDSGNLKMVVFGCFVAMMVAGHRAKQLWLGPFVLKRR
ncbi:MAG: hypothetical protein Q8755_02810, partial [Candidatus Phytoplasma australasiaticum]|nr:hypothetical protein [Candidatus Phytoplasma australasiaticum]